MDEHFGGGDVSEFLRRVNEDPAFTFDTEHAVLKYSTDALDAVKAAMPKPLACCPRPTCSLNPTPSSQRAAQGVSPLV
ncbi:MAG: hypothetical protein CM15mP103_02430 [Gammaproteobacteria bacterium]|nr:MAG: hypothetical protein CM15mP103_02430 [Gammaproteobacteria bacterium]